MAGDASRLNGKKGGRPRKVATPKLSPAVDPVSNPHKLLPEELLFVEAYTGVSKFNANDAYRRAGYKADKRGALAARLLGRDRVAAAVAERLSARLHTLQMDGDEALEGISRLARSDIRQVFDAEGNLKPIIELDDAAADAIQSIEVIARRVPDGDGGFRVEYTHKIKHYDKLKARELMAKAAGKLVDRHAGADGEPLVPREVLHIHETVTPE